MSMSSVLILKCPTIADSVAEMARSPFVPASCRAAPLAVLLMDVETPWMLRETSEAPSVDWVTLWASYSVEDVMFCSEREISAAVADCSSTADAIFRAIWLTCSITWTTSSIAPVEFAVSF